MGILTPRGYIGNRTDWGATLSPTQGFGIPREQADATLARDIAETVARFGSHHYLSDVRGNRSRARESEVVAMDDVTYAAAVAAAAELGREHGLSAGSWVIDGNTDDASIRRLLDGISDGDPMILDALPSSPLSGEFAGGMTPARLYEAIDAEFDPETMLVDEFSDAYEQAYSDAVVEQVEIEARRYFGERV